MMARQYQKALDQKELLQRINPEEKMEEAMFGAVVLTEKQSVFISISLGKLTVEGTYIFAISPQTPFFEAIHNKKEGEEYDFRGTKGKILSLF